MSSPRLPEAQRLASSNAESGKSTPLLRARKGRLGALEPARLLIVNERSAEPQELTSVLTSRDLLVINDAATLPASLPVMFFGALPGELRLTEAPTRTATGKARVTAVLFGSGDFRTPTEARLPPPRVAVGATVQFRSVTLRVIRVSALSTRLVTMESSESFEQLVAALYRHGSVVQYAYVPNALHLWDAQTSFARVPFAVEAPSATYLLPRALPCDAVFLSHAAGLSDTGDASLNAQLPFPERYVIPAETASAIERAKNRGGKVIAVGTSVTRALETAARKANSDAAGRLHVGPGTSDLHIGAATERRVVDGIVTGVHDVATSHRSLLTAFVSASALTRAYARSQALALYTHEFGDGWLVLPER